MLFHFSHPLSCFSCSFILLPFLSAYFSPSSPSCTLSHFLPPLSFLSLSHTQTHTLVSIRYLSIFYHFITLSLFLSSILIFCPLFPLALSFITFSFWFLTFQSFFHSQVFFPFLLLSYFFFHPLALIYFLPLIFHKSFLFLNPHVLFLFLTCSPFYFSVFRKKVSPPPHCICRKSKQKRGEKESKKVLPYIPFNNPDDLTSNLLFTSSWRSIFFSTCLLGHGHYNLLSVQEEAPYEGRVSAQSFSSSHESFAKKEIP